MKSIACILGLLFSMTVSAQMGEVKFKELTFENGMTYPNVIIKEAPEIETSINQGISERLKDVEASDFCIGQYGYVQKGMHLQLLIFCNCIDFAESENRYLLFNLETGQAVPYSDILGAKRKEATGIFLLEKTTEFLGGQELSAELQEKIKSENLDAFNVEMTRAGISISLKDYEAWGDNTLNLSWGELRSYLRVNYI